MELGIGRLRKPYAAPTLIASVQAAERLAGQPVKPSAGLVLFHHPSGPG